jgi:hypothetical protein
MAQKFSNGIDLVQGPLNNAVVQNLPTAGLPGAPLPGQIAYDTTINAMVIWNGTAWVPTDAAKVGNGSIPLAKLATDPLARANHTGQQTASTISDFTAAVQAIQWRSMQPPTAAVSLNTQELTNLGNATQDSSAISLGQAKQLLYGVLTRRVARASTTADININAPGAAHDGVNLNPGDNLFVGMNQANGAQRGLYTFNGAAVPLTRTPDTDGSTELQAGLEIYVDQGATLGNRTFRLDTDNPIVVGTTVLVWTDLGASNTYTAGNGINISGGVVSAVAAPGGGVSVGATGIALDPVVAVRKHVQTITGNGALTSFDVDHNLNSRAVSVSMREKIAPFASWIPDNVAPTVNRVQVLFAVAPANLVEYEVVVMG